MSDEQLEATILGELCRFDRLDESTTPLRRAPLVRRGRVCGRMYTVEGPRSLRTSAIWTADEGRVVFYDSCGQRAGEMRVGAVSKTT